MPSPSILALYAVARALAGHLREAAARGRAGEVVADLAAAARAVAGDADRTSEGEGRAAERLHAVLCHLDPRAVDAAAADVVAEMLGRWFGPQGLPEADVPAFDRLVARLPAADGSPGCECGSFTSPDAVEG